MMRATPLRNQSSVFDRRRNEKACHRCLISRTRDMPKFSRTFWPFRPFRIHEKVRRIKRLARRHFVFYFEFFLWLMMGRPGSFALM